MAIFAPERSAVNLNRVSRDTEGTRPSVRLYSPREPGPGDVDERGRRLLGYAPTLTLADGTVSQGYAYRDRSTAEKVLEISLDEPDVSGGEVVAVYEVPIELPRKMPPMAAAILDALRESLAPISGLRIARKSGYSFSSRLRSTLAEMARAGYILRNHEGYRLASETVIE